MTDIEDFHKFINNPSHIRTRDDFLNYDIKYPNIYNFLEDSIINIIDNPPKNKNEFNKNINTILQKYKLPKLKNVLLIYIVKKFYCENKMSREIFDIYINFLRAKNCRSLSGILEVAIMTSPYNMAGSNNGCDYDCYFCPNQKGFPRSYIKEEPAVRRAQQMGFNTIKQTHDRLSSYMCNGHNIDKIEIIVLGGTWSSYEYEYQKEFMRDTYYALNTFYSNNNRNKLSLEEEKTINMTSLCKMVGLTIETRPDSITQEEIINFLGFGVTRVQLGVQTTNDYVLKKINRGCYNKDTISAISLLKDAGLKIMIHLMQNLPYSTPEIDKQTFKDILYNPDYQIDEIKVYPTSVTKTSDKDNTEVNTVIEKWYNDGKYIPYSNEKLFDVIYYLKENIHSYIRIARIFRDIPIANITGGANIPHMRQIIQNNMEKDDKYCKCIRCCEIKNTDFELNEIYYTNERYVSSNGDEYFISANIQSTCNNPYKSTLVGFLKLRIKNEKCHHFIDTLNGSSIVRELKVYGRMIPVFFNKKYDTINNNNNSNSQHKGIGKELLKIAEKLTQSHGLTKICVISGVGVRKYYEKQGYNLDGDYMSKKLSQNTVNSSNNKIYNLIINNYRYIRISNYKYILILLFIIYYIYKANIINKIYYLLS
jgi:ELP3 family radical SAM enzyme/protein acetyltransferase